jgi:RNA polymerase sigma-70 factor (ECF subfamily)
MVYPRPPAGARGKAGAPRAKEGRRSRHQGASPGRRLALTAIAHADDLALRDRVAAGDRQAATDLFRRHLDALFEFVHWRVGRDRAAAEDVVQDTFLVVLQRLSSFDGRSSLHTWLCGIAKNRIRMARRKRRPAPLADVLEGADPEIFDVLADLESEDLPGWALEREETRALVGATLSSLPPDYRAALLQKYVEGLSVNEMAARAGKSPKATESRLTRARVAFGKVFTLLNGRAGGGEPEGDVP